MKAAGILAAAVVLVSVSAGAQQRPEPLPTDDGTQNQTNIPVIKQFPCTAAQYDAFLKWELGMLQALVGKGPVTTGDLNKVTLRVKDCASRVEADGYVTEGEFAYCDRRLNDTVDEIERAYQLSQ